MKFLYVNGYSVRKLFLCVMQLPLSVKIVDGQLLFRCDAQYTLIGLLSLQTHF